VGNGSVTGVEVGNGGGVGLALERARAVFVPATHGVGLEAAGGVFVSVALDVGLEAARAVCVHPMQGVGLRSAWVVFVPVMNGVNDATSVGVSDGEGVRGPKVQAARFTNKTKTNKDFFTLTISLLLRIDKKYAQLMCGYHFPAGLGSN
jgi:hypothetical protein